MIYIIAIIIGYLFGSIPTALLVGKRKNIDIRKHGSGNIGGTNTFRVLGKKAGYTVSIIDVLKGVLPTLLGLYFGNEVIAILAGLSASFGHSYSIFASFKGGKSVATSAGVMLVLSPLSVVIGIIVFVITLLTTRFVSLSSMLGASGVAISVWVLETNKVLIYTAAIFSLFIILRHRANIKRLIQGNENKAFQKKK